MSRDGHAAVPGCGSSHRNECCNRERKLSKTLTIDGPLTTCLATVQATLNEIECSIAIQNEGFENLIRGSQITLEEVLKNAPSNWYVEAEEARRLGLVEAVL
jgi:hypothetical protein